MPWWLIVAAHDRWGRFYFAQAGIPRSWKGARLRVVGAHTDEGEAKRIAALLEQKRLDARWRRDVLRPYGLRRVGRGA